MRSVFEPSSVLAVAILALSECAYNRNFWLAVPVGCLLLAHLRWPDSRESLAPLLYLVAICVTSDVYPFCD